jgi:hypothetical protein
VRQAALAGVGVVIGAPDTRQPVGSTFTMNFGASLR